jgi:hypothetical protein
MGRARQCPNERHGSCDLEHTPETYNGGRHGIERKDLPERRQAMKALGIAATGASLAPLLARC